MVWDCGYHNMCVIVLSERGGENRAWNSDVLIVYYPEIRFEPTVSPVFRD